MQGLHSTCIVPLPYGLTVLRDNILKEALDPVIDLANIFIAVLELDRIAVNLEVLVAIDYLSIVDLVGVVGLGEYVLDH